MQTDTRRSLVLNIYESSILYLAISSEENLLEKEIYNDQDRLVSAEDHVYDTTKVLKYISGLGVAKGCIYEQRTLVEDYPLRTLRLITYQGEDSVCIENRFGYNDLGQTIQTETDDSQGIVQTVKTRYVADIPTAERTMVENSMIEHNVLQNPLVIFEYIKKPGSSEKLVRGIRSQFGVFGYDSKLIKPICIEKTNLERPIDSVNFDAETHWKIIKTFDEYDNLGNVIQSTDKAGSDNGLHLGIQRFATRCGGRKLRPVARGDDHSVRFDGR